MTAAAAVHVGDAHPIVPGPELGAAAAAYVARGWAVFPLKPCSKQPATAHGVKDARSSPYWCRTYWGQHPKGNIGLGCGEASGVWALDIDVKGDKPGYETLAALERLFGQLPATLTQKTPSGGEQRFFQYPGHKIGNSVEKKLGPGLDTRGDGGYVVLPPSIHPDHLSGPRYAWIDKATPIAKAPAWLLTLIDGTPEELDALRAGLDGRAIPDYLAKRLGVPVAKAPAAPKRVAADLRVSAYARAALDDECRAVRQAMPGSQNDRLNIASYNLGGLIEAGALPEHLVLQHLTVAAHAMVCDPRKGPWTPPQIDRVITGGIRAGRQNRRELPEPSSTGASPRYVGGGAALAHRSEDLERARALWDGAVPVAGTASARFLIRFCGVDPEASWPMLRHAESLEVELPDGAGTWVKLGRSRALLAAMGRWRIDDKVPDLSAVYVVHLAPDGAGLTVDDPRSGRPVRARRYVGAWSGAACRLTPLFAPRLVLASGLTDGLGLLARRSDISVWVAGTAAALARVALPERVREVIVVGAGRSPLDRQRAIAAGLRGDTGRVVRIAPAAGGR